MKCGTRTLKIEIIALKMSVQVSWHSPFCTVCPRNRGLLSLHSMEDCSLSLGNSKHSSVRTLNPSATPKEIIPCTDQPKLITTIFPILAFCYIWLTRFWAFSCNLESHKLLIPKAPQDPLIPGDGALREKNSRSSKEIQTIPNSTGVCPLHFTASSGIYVPFSNKEKKQIYLGQSHLWQPIATKQRWLNKTILGVGSWQDTLLACHGRNMSENRLMLSK